MNTIPASELILNPDGSIYHLALRPEHIADTIITVGDPQRVDRVSKLFDTIYFRQQKREFVTHTGRIGAKDITVHSTGIGTDNIDIVFNELDALVNIDLTNRKINSQKKSLNLIRIGTSGAIHNNLEVGSILLSKYAIGLEGLLPFYERKQTKNEKLLANRFNTYLHQKERHFPVNASYTTSSSTLFDHFISCDDSYKKGITLTATGFYGPQNRNLRLSSVLSGIFDTLDDFCFDDLHITNLEMETAGIYGLASMLGHNALSINAIMANRRKQTFHSQPEKLEKKLIESTLTYLENLI